MKVDSGASKTYFKKEHQRYLKQLVTLLFGPQAIFPNNERIRATEEKDLNLHPKINLKALVYPKPNNESLLVIGQLCDEGCIDVSRKNLKHLQR